MADGQVGFKDDRLVFLSQTSLRPPPPDCDLTSLPQVRKVHVTQRENAIVNRLNKTKVEKHPDLKQEREDRLRELRKREQATQQERVGPPPFSRPLPPRGGLTVATNAGRTPNRRRRRRPG